MLYARLDYEAALSIIRPLANQIDQAYYYEKSEYHQIKAKILEQLDNTIKYASKPASPKIAIHSTLNNHDTYILEIKDNGMKVPENKLNQLFHFDRQTK
ncbi:MAG: ATP-binding protein [Bacteroidota bacterium]